MHYALQKLHILPSQFAAMSRGEKTLVIASIDLRAKAEKKQLDDLEAGRNG
ncbi:hypothetical protein [Acidaminococcus timonensis]|uniref:hypothetical protein n=1 Tax=Acidaminococcus timonensis TaxID=1871002 RepID=UPI00307B04FE